MRIHEPNDGNFADAETGIVLFNQFGGTASQDTGRDARVLADTFNLPVVAVDRPGTASLMPHRKLEQSLATPHGYLLEMSELGRDIDRQVDSLGIKKLIAAGRSAGGLGALALARSEMVTSLVAVFTAEPVGCEDMPLKEGTKRYSEYLKSQKELLDAATDDELVKPLPPGLALFPAISRLISIPPAMLVDRFHNQRIFASDAALEYAAYIAERLTLVDTTLEFAEHSMVATNEVYDRDIRPLSELRAENGAPFEVKKPSGTVHASFDNRDYMSKVIAPTIDRTIAR
jgi:pimeloyl-ACP methyl ester carboxylesterase